MFEWLTRFTFLLYYSIFLCFISFTVLILFDLFVFHLFYFYTYFFYLLFNFGTIIFHRISWLKHKCKSLESFSRTDIIASYLFKHLRIFFKNMFTPEESKEKKSFYFYGTLSNELYFQVLIKICRTDHIFYSAR